MSKVINTFTGGMSRDSSPTKQDNKHIFYAENFRITTQNGLSTGILENEKGNSVSIIFPQTCTYRGHCFIRNDLILFTVKGVNPISGAVPPADDAIFRINHNTLLTAITTNTPITINTSYYHLAPTINNLVYTNSNLGFSILNSDSLYTFSRYESPSIQKVYFSDTNGLRYINLIHNSEYNDLTSTIDLNTISEVSINKPTTSITSGGNISVGKIQYAVQFYSLYGAETFFSPLSDPIFISKSIINPSHVYELRGGSEGEFANKSVNLTISLNSIVTKTLSDFSRMRVVAIEYKTPTLVPSIRLFFDSNISTSGTSIVVTDNGESLGTLSIEEFSGLSNNIFTPSFLTGKDNILFAANISEDYFDIDTYDSRAYRFENIGTINSVIYENDDTYYTISTDGSWIYSGGGTGTSWSIPITADGINKYNFFQQEHVAANMFMYQTDGTTLGAEGKNIELSITETVCNIDTVAASTTDINILDSVLSDPLTGSRGYYLGGEIYRIGIVFRDNYGRRSLPSWICDLRFPDHLENASSICAASTTIQYRVYSLNALVKTLPTNAVSWEIVRCIRKDTDKTVLGYGVLKSLASITFGGDDILAFTDVPMCEDPATTDYINASLLSLRHNLFGFISPDFLIDNLSIEDDYYIKLIGLVSTREISSGTLTSLGYPDLSGGNDSFATRVKYNTIKKRDTNEYEDISILDNVNLHEEPFGVYSGAILSGETDSIRNLTFRLNIGSGGNDEYGQGGKTTVVKLNSTPDIASSSNFVDYDLLYGYIHRDSYASSYGGYTYEARTMSEYIGCGAESVLLNTLVYIYGGDTYPGMFTYLNSHIIPDTESPTWTGNKVFSYFSFPVECSYNLYVANGVNPISEANNVTSCMMRTSAGVYQTLSSTHQLYIQEKNLYDYNKSYSRDLDVVKFLAEEDLRNETIFDCRVYGSDIKINGELSDSWLKFKVDNYIDVDTRYGPITHLFTYNDVLYFFQEKAFGYLPINEETTVATDTNSKLALANGGILERYKYISTESGILNDKELVTTKYGIFWVDRLNQSICLYTGSQSNLSELKLEKDLDSYITPLANSTSPIYVGYNDDRKDVYFSFFSLNKTLLYNTVSNTFTELLPFYSDLFIPVDKYLLSKGSVDDNLYLHGYGNRGTFYGTTYPSILHFIVNPGTNTIYDTLEWFSECLNITGTKVNNTISSIRVKTGYQDSGDITLSPYINVGQRFRTWWTPIPRAIYNNFGTPLERTDGRMRDYYLLVEVEFDNTNNDVFYLYDVMTSFTQGNG